MKAAVLAEKLGCSVEGEDRELTGAAGLEAAGAAHLSFVAGSKQFESGLDSQAGCLIAGPDYAAAEGQTVIRGEHPRALFAAALAILFPPRALRPGIHPTTHVGPGVAVASSAEVGPLCTIDEGSIIGPETRLGAGCHIGSQVHIGAGCELHAGVTIYDGVRVGDRVILHSGCVLGADGFGFAPQNGKWVKFPQVGGVEIGDDVEIGANSAVDRAALGWTRIGAGTKLDNMVHIGHNCDIGQDVVIAAQTGLSGGVVIGDGAVVGGQVGIGDKARIESGVVLGSGAGVLTSKIVRAGEPQWGTPARPLKQYLRQLALFARLPELRTELRRLRARVDQMEKHASKDKP